MTVLELLDLYNTDCEQCEVNIVIDGSDHVMPINEAIDSVYRDYEVSMISVEDNMLTMYLVG